MTTSLHLRPIGLCWGEDARQAVAAGCAGCLAGLAIAFTEIELIERDADRDLRSLRPYADLAASTDPVVAAALARHVLTTRDLQGEVVKPADLHHHDTAGAA